MLLIQTGLSVGSLKQQKEEILEKIGNRLVFPQEIDANSDPGIKIKNESN